MANLIDVRGQLNADLPLYISNKLIEAHFSLPLGEQRLLYTYISKLSEEHIEFPELEISVKEFAAMLEVDLNYKVVKAQCKKLLERVVEIETDEEWLGFQWFSVCRYRHKEGRLKLKIHDELKPYLLRLKKEFTRLITKQVMQFRSVYSIRIYMLCKQYQGIGKRLISIDELKQKLGIGQNEYSLYSNLKKRVLEQALKEINNASDIYIKYEEIKKVRKVTEILFIINDSLLNDIKNDGVVNTFKVKSHSELAFTLIKEIQKRWKQELKLSIVANYSKDVIIELLCAILCGGYDGRNINNVNMYFKAGLDAIEKELKI